MRHAINRFATRDFVLSKIVCRTVACQFTHLLIPHSQILKFPNSQIHYSVFTSNFTPVTPFVSTATM
jgi:hypothetical protein